MTARASRRKPIEVSRFELVSFRPDQIIVRKGRRAINEDTVQCLMKSMREIGLKTPISVRYFPERPSFLPPIENSCDAIVLLAGAHRLEAAKRLGWANIQCLAHDIGDYLEAPMMDDIEAELWEIAENLHRAELTALERDEHLARWIKLTEQRQSDFSDKLSEKSRGRPEGGVAAASSELGVHERDARRAVQVASLSPDAKQTARDIGLDNNRTVLLQAAKQEGSGAQVHCLQAEAQKRKKQPESHAEKIEKESARMMKAWESGTTQSRRKFWQQIANSKELSFVKSACPPEPNAAAGGAGA